MFDPLQKIMHASMYSVVQKVSELSNFGKNLAANCSETQHQVCQVQEKQRKISQPSCKLDVDWVTELGVKAHSTLNTPFWRCSSSQPTSWPVLTNKIDTGHGQVFNVCLILISSWCHCRRNISCFSKIQNGLPFWCLLTRVVLEKRPLNGCSVVVLLCYKDGQMSAFQQWEKYIAAVSNSWMMQSPSALLK